MPSRRNAPVPWYVRKLVRPAQDDVVDSYGHAFAVLAICGCGHAAEVPGAYAEASATGDMDFVRLREKLRCGKCGAKRPKVEAYRRPRLK